jgi:hypothetical protein
MEVGLHIVFSSMLTRGLWSVSWSVFNPRRVVITEMRQIGAKPCALLAATSAAGHLLIRTLMRS